MENASKALLIAASILIVIILIAFGMQTLNSTKGTQDSVKITMDATEKTTFNSKFTSYFGSNKTPAQAKALVTAIISNNATNTNKKIGVRFLGSTEADYTPEILSDKVSAIEGKCKISGNYNDDGLIYEILIIEQ